MTTPITVYSEVETIFRRVVKQESTSTLSSATFQEYLNRFIIYHMPARLQVFSLKRQYSFVTTPNVDRYAAPINTYQMFDGPAYVDGQQVRLFQDVDQFNKVSPPISENRDETSGTGIIGPYAFTLSSIPIIRGFNYYTGTTQSYVDPALRITADDSSGNRLVLSDDGSGNLTGDGTGTINYITGAVSATFSAVIPNTSIITSISQPYTAGFPNFILFFNQAFVLRSVPDRAYEVRMNAYMTPVGFLNTSDALPFRWMGEYFARGAARIFLSDQGDTEQVQFYEPFFREQEAQVLRRSERQKSTQRAATIFSGQTGFNYANQRI